MRGGGLMVTTLVSDLHQGVLIGTCELNAGGNLGMVWYPSHGRGVEILLVSDSCNWDRDKLWPDGPLGSHVGGK